MSSVKRRLKRLRKVALYKQKGACFWCGDPMIVKTQDNASGVWNHPKMATADHLIRTADGGLTVDGNIVAACLYCNTRRHWSAYDLVKDENQRKKDRPE